MRDWTASPRLAYAYGPNGTLFPGTQAQADAAERLAEDEMEAELGLAANELLNTATITIAN